MFQSLRGFWVGWNQMGTSRVAIIDIDWFQSLRGFWVGWNVGKAANLSCIVWFQSLRGFWVGWNRDKDLSGFEIGSEFQSLRGFWVGWNLTKETEATTGALVSIPKRVLGWLERQ